MSRKVTVLFTQEITKEITISVPEHVTDEEVDQYAIDQGHEALPIDVEADGEWDAVGVRRHS